MRPSTAVERRRGSRERLARLLPELGLALSILTVAGGLWAAGTEDLLREGEGLFKSGRYQEAAASFQMALDADPSSAEAKKDLADAWAAMGHAALQRGSWDEAKKLAEKASQLRPEEPRFQFLLAVILFRQGDFYYSRWAVKKALELAPDNPQAHDLLGDILYQDGYLDLAIPEWEAAQEKGGNRETLQRKIEKTRKEMNVEEGFGRDVSRHFTIQYDGPVQRWLVQAVLRDLEEAYDRIRRELGASPKGDVTVILYSRMIFHEVTRSPGWVGGRFDGKVRVPVGGLADEADAAKLKPVLTHELAHAFLRGMVPQGLPLWLEEGLAEQFEGIETQAARDRLKNSGLKFSTLEEVSRVLRAGPEVETAYAAAALAVHALIEEGGFWTVRRILEDMGAGQPFPAALEAEARLNVEELQDLWRRTLP